MRQRNLLFLFTRVARKIACLHADLASTAITLENCKSEFLVVAFCDNILYTIPDS